MLNPIAGVDESMSAAGDIAHDVVWSTTRSVT